MCDSLGDSRDILTNPDVSEPDVTQRTTVATPAPKWDCKQQSHLHTQVQRLPTITEANKCFIIT